MVRRGAVAEWLGRGLQSLVQRFESARRLFVRVGRPRVWFRSIREAWLPALLGLPRHPRLVARSLREEGLGFVRFWPRLRATVPGWTGVLEGRSLYALARSGPGQGAIVEVGSAWGRSTICLARGSKSAGRERVHAVDSHLRDPDPGLWPR